MSTFYIVRNKQTEECLPIAKQRNSTSARLSTTLPPRLFRTSGAAKNALNWWSQGVSYANYGRGDDYLIDVVKVRDRNKDDMEVVEVTLTLSEVKHV